MEEDTPETEAEMGETGATGFEALGTIGSLLGGRNAKPDTAQGVADLLSQTREHVEEHAFARMALIQGPDGKGAPMVMFPDGRYEIMLPSVTDQFADNPRFRRGAARMTSLTSFIDHVNRFGDEDSAVFANDDRTSPSLTAVLDYHRQDTLPTSEDERRVHGEYRHGKHRTTFAFPVSDQWQAWTASNGKPMDMLAFAKFIDENVCDVAEVTTPPESADRFVKTNGGPSRIADWATLTKMSRTMTVFENGVVRQVQNLASGEGELTLAENHDAEIDGIKVMIPTMFFIDVPIFRDGPLYRIGVRLRYRSRGGLAFFYEMWQHDRAFADAVKEAVERVDEETEAQVFYGQPEA